MKRIAVWPTNHRHEFLRSAVQEAGGELVDDVSAASALIWGDTQPGDLANILHDGIDWVQLPWAGIEPFIAVLDDRRRWTCGKGIYAGPVAEHVLAMTLACLHNLHGYAREQEWASPRGDNLQGKQVLILGGGGITEELLALLKPFNCHTVVIRRNTTPLPGADKTLQAEQLHAELPQADIIVLALALTDATSGILAAEEFRLMKPDACVINVARGGHIVTDDLVTALRQGEIGAAALDVTDPEPLPSGHPLWQEPRCLITPHVGNTPEMGIRLLRAHIVENTRRYLAGETLLSPVDSVAGY